MSAGNVVFTGYSPFSSRCEHFSRSLFRVSIGMSEQGQARASRLLRLLCGTPYVQPDIQPDRIYLRHSVAQDGQIAELQFPGNDARNGFQAGPVGGKELEAHQILSSARSSPALCSRRECTPCPTPRMEKKNFSTCKYCVSRAVFLRREAFLFWGFGAFAHASP